MGPEDIVATELFRGVDADERLAEKADAWRRTLIARDLERLRPASSPGEGVSIGQSAFFCLKVTAV